MAEKDECPTLSVHLGNIHGQSPAKRQKLECLKEAELDELLDGATSKSTDYAATHAARIFYKRIIKRLPC